jgi:hypothetical protein
MGYIKVKTSLRHYIAKHKSIWIKYTHSESDTITKESRRDRRVREEGYIHKYVKAATKQELDIYKRNQASKRRRRTAIPKTTKTPAKMQQPTQPRCKKTKTKKDIATGYLFSSLSISSFVIFGCPGCN